MSDEVSQIQPGASADGDAAGTPQPTVPDASQAAEPSGGEPTAPESEAVESQPQAGGDVSTASPTAPVPPPGVPAEPVNAEARDGDVPGPRMDPARIGEALKPPVA